MADYAFSASISNPTVEYDIGAVPEDNIGIVSVIFNSVADFTPFIRTIADGDTIIVEALSIYEGKTFNLWRTIYVDGTNDVSYNPIVSMDITESIELRAVYVAPMFREDVEYGGVGPIVPPVSAVISSGSNNFINVEYELV